jgi:acetoin utilization deacetylase AcuC-like enzyme
MILYHKDFGPFFKKFGVSNLIDDNRATAIYQKIKKVIPRKFIHQKMTKVKALKRNDLLLAHEARYVDKLMGPDCLPLIEECFEIEHFFKPLNQVKKIVPHLLRHAAGTKTAMQLALKEGFCFYLGGGMHHAMSFGGRGYCLVNDVVIAIRALQKKQQIKNIWVIDIDAHKGDGTAQITKDDKSIITLSIHMKDAWPLDGVKNSPSHIPSKIDILIGRGEEKNYLKKLGQGLVKLESNHQRPDLAIVIAGSDPYIKDSLPGTQDLKLSKKQMLDRDKLVYHFLKKQNIPQCYVIGGGYGKYSAEIYEQFLIWVYHERC